MTVLYKKENNQFTASFEDSEGFKTHFGPYPIKLSMILCVHEHFRNSKKGIPMISKQPWKSLIIDGIDYGKKLHDLSFRLRFNLQGFNRLEFMDIWQKTGLLLHSPISSPIFIHNPMDNAKIIRKYD